MKRRLLVFGSTGQVARELARAQWPQGFALTFLDRGAADFNEPDLLAGLVRRHKPHAVLIAAAYTNVDSAESDEATAIAVNATAPAAIARAAAELSAPILFISTDYVFDGEKHGFYDESSPVNPINAYGRSKLAGEVEVRAANPQHLILRTSWVYSAHGTNFLRKMVRLAASVEEISVVSDQRGCPTAADDLARAIARIAPRFFDNAMPWGTFHLAGGSEASWHGFAEAILRQLTKRGHRRPTSRPISTADFDQPARRPMNSRLSCDAFARQFGFRLPGFEVSMPIVLDELLAARMQLAEAEGQ
jgi:dTDP-4-dehydrorhamnose reductase